MVLKQQLYSDPVTHRLPLSMRVYESADIQDRPVECRTCDGCFVGIYAAEELPPAVGCEVVVGAEEFTDGTPFFSVVSLVIPSKIRSVLLTSGSELMPG